MDRPQRDIVYCHECENEWYRDESGLTCPDCNSDFTEIVEGANDPRAAHGQDDARPAANNPVVNPLHDHDPWNAPDPDEDDIDHFQWQEGPRYRATFNRTYNLDGRGQAQGQGQAGPGAAGGLLGMIGNMVGGLLQQTPQQQEQGYGQHERGQGQGDDHEARPQSALGEPSAGEQQQGGRPGTFTRHIHGPGYSFTMTATSGGNLSPRNANNAQPLNAQPQDMDDLMQQMFNNIGGFPPLMPGQDPHQNQQQPRGPGGNPVFPATLFQLLNNLAPPGGVHGDAVYSQEALDRIVSQLMEQHQAGNAPGPASEAAIRSLPTRPITEADGGDAGSADCSICMETAPLGQIVTSLPCSHWFHEECIRLWLGAHDTCPVCRKGIMPQDSAAEGGGARTSTQAPLNDTSTAAAAAATTPSGAGSNSAGVFSRMRDAFGGGDGGNSRAPGSGGAGGGTGDNRTT